MTYENFPNLFTVCISELENLHTEFLMGMKRTSLAHECAVM